METKAEILEFCRDADVKSVQLTFCDVFGVPKNVAIPVHGLERAFETGVSFDASAIAGFGDERRSDLLLFPEPETLLLLPWRSGEGRVARILCCIRQPDGTPFEGDCRMLLRKAVQEAAKDGVGLNIGTEFEFYLFKTDVSGYPTHDPLDYAGYMDAAPEDRGEDVRREIAMMLTQMGMLPESAHHEQGPSQHEIDFRFSDALSAADNALLFPTIVKTCAMRNGLYADFSPKPLEGESGSGLHINLSLTPPGSEEATGAFMAGLLTHIRGITGFLNPVPASYKRLFEKKAPGYVAWSAENRSPLIRIPAAQGDYRRMELRSPDPMANPYLAFMLVLRAGLSGVRTGLVPPPPVDVNLYTAGRAALEGLAALPRTPEEAVRLMESSDLVKAAVPERMRLAYRQRLLS